MPRSTIRIFDVIFLARCSFCVPTNLWDAIPFFPRLYMTDPNIRKKKKWPKLVWEKQKRKRDGSEYICTCVSNTCWKFQSETCKIERNIADKPFFRNYLIYILNHVFGSLLMGGELGNETFINLLLASSALSLARGEESLDETTNPCPVANGECNIIMKYG